MSKLRADITWNNRFKSDSSPTPLNITIDTYSTKYSDINDNEIVKKLKMLKIFLQKKN